MTSGKGIILYELVVDMQSLLLTPDGEQFWKKTEFFSELKLQAVDGESYENSKFLYKTLKMRNLGDLNDLYNTQDVILLCEILESRFQAMQNTYGFNPRKCNSASTMSNCIEREMSKVIMLKFLNKQLLAVLVLLIIGWLLTPNYYYPTL